MTNLKYILKNLIDEYSITANELARNTGVPQPVIHKIIKGKTENPNLSTLRAIAKFFSVSVSELIGETPILNGKNNFKQNKIQHYPQPRKIPLINWKEIPLWLEHDTAEFLEFTSIIGLVGKKTFALKLNDLNSNIDDPEFRDNSIIIVEPDIRPRNRDYVVIKHLQNNHYLLRQLLIDGINQYLKPLNSEASSRKISVKEKIIGVVIENRRAYINIDKRVSPDL
jgi:SOS-response transcriptional repressor LexA